MRFRVIISTTFPNFVHMKAEQLYGFLQKVKEGQLKEYGYSEPQNIFIGDLHASDEQDELFSYCVKNNLVESEPSSDPWFTNPKTFRLTPGGKRKTGGT